MIISFMQNDDWVYHRMVASFLEGDFVLDAISAPTFYTQGFLGMWFLRLFPSVPLLVLTLLITFLNLLIFYLIIHRYFLSSRVKALLISLIFFFNPLHIYSALGFMTENYFLLFFLLSLLFFLEFERKRNMFSLFILLISVVFGFFLRQVALVFPLSLAAIYLYKSPFHSKRNFSLFGISAIFFVGLYIFYERYFPKTPEMYEKSLQFHHFKSFDYSYALVYGSFLLLTAFLLPIILNFVTSFFQDVRKENTNLRLFSNMKLLLILLVAGTLYWILNKLFIPEAVSWGEFPYFENTFERTGFYPRGILGTKFHFKGIFDLYKYWDVAAKILLSLFLAILLVYRRTFAKQKGGLINFFSIYALIYLGLMVVTETFYDRYLLILVPVSILFFLQLGAVSNISTVSGKFSRLVFAGFIVFQAFLAYQFSMDFILTNSYVWRRSEQLVSQEGVFPTQIQGTNAWKLNYQNTTGMYDYDFSYDSFAVNEGYLCCYALIEEHEIEFPFSLYVNPRIYLYKKIREPLIIQ